MTWWAGSMRRLRHWLAPRGAQAPAACAVGSPAAIAPAAPPGAAEVMARGESPATAAAPSWRVVLDALPAHVAVLDWRGTIIATNRGWIEFARANQYAGDPTAGNYLAVCDRAVGAGAEDARRMATAIRAILAGERSTFTMRYACHAPHQARWFAAYVTRTDGHLVVAHTDVTAEMLAAQSLRRSEERFRCVVEYSPEIVAILDAYARITYLSPNADAVLGRPAEAVTGRTIDEFLHPDDAGLVRERVADLAAGRSAVVEFPPLRVRRGEHDWRWIEAVARNLLDVRAVHGVMVNFRDVSGYVQAEARLQASEQRLHLALAVARAGVWEYDVATGETFWSDESYALLGYEPGSITPSFEAWLARVHPDDRAQIGREAERLRAEPTAFSFDLRICLPDRSVRWLSCVGRVVEHDPDGHVRRLLGLQIDVTERRRAEEALRALNAELEHRVAERTAELARANAELARAARLKDELLASMSHELHTPLAGILGTAAALADGAYGPLAPAQARALGDLQTSGEQLLALITDLLDLARIGAGRLPLEPVRLCPAAVCERAAAAIAPLAATRQITVTTAVDPALPEVRADPRRLAQVLGKLLGNAVTFTPDGGAIGVEARHDAAGGAVEITVWDSSIGIAPADVRDLFEPFVRIGGGLAPRFPGTGLGLSLVRRLIELHGGSVQLECTPARGCRFTVRVPLAAPPAASAAEAGAAPPPDAPLVLLADDDVAVCAAFTAAFGARGQRTCCVSDAHEALAQAAAQRPAAVVLDLQLPGGAGLGFARVLRDAAGAGVPLVIVASLALPGDRDEALAAGAAEFLLKPVRADRLADRLAELLAR